jgi:hypothetical protein
MRAFGHLDNIMAASVDELAAVDGVGPTIAASDAAWFAEPANQAVIEKLRESGVNFEGPEASDAPQTLTGQAVVVTGTLAGYTRDQAEAVIKAHGGKSPSSVWKKTLAVVVGEGPGASKLTKAEDLGVPILDEAGFTELLATGRCRAPNPLPRLNQNRSPRDRNPPRRCRGVRLRRRLHPVAVRRHGHPRRSPRHRAVRPWPTSRALRP